MTPPGAYDRLPPQNLEAEQSVIGAVLIEGSSLMKCIDIVKEDDFYREAHRKIYTAMMQLFDRNEAIDLVTCAEELDKQGSLEAIGGAAYLAALAAQVPTAANIAYHARIVREKALLRALLRAGTDIAGKVYEDGNSAEEMLDYAERTVFEISERRISAPFQKMKAVVKDSFNMIEKLFNRKEAITGISSGYAGLDEFTSGFQRGDLIIVGGRPSMGKTAFALNVAQHVGVESKESVAIFSLEMSTRQLAMRMLCTEAMVDSKKVMRGILGKPEWHRLTSAAGRLSEAQLFIDDSSALNVLEMRAKARRLYMELGGLSLIVVDYLQLMRGRGGSERREQEISEISRSLKALAKELDVPVMALSQLNRDVERRDNRRPGLADLRESGAIEQDADVILFLFRPEVYDRDNPEKKGIAEVILSKQRNGPTGTVRLSYLNYCTKFTNMAEGYDAEEPIDETSPF